MTISSALTFRQPLNSYIAWAAVIVAAAAIVALAISPQVAALLLLAAAACWWAWENPTAAFMLLITVSPLLPMFKVTQTFGSITLLKDVLLIVLAAKLIGLPLLRKQLPYRPNILWLPLLGLVAWLAIATLRADSLTLGVLRARELGLYLVAYFVALYLPRRRAFLTELATWLLLAYGAVLLNGMYQWYFAQSSTVLRFDPARSIWIPRISATLAHPSVLGEYLILITATASAVAVTARGKLKLVLSLTALSTLPLIYLTYSRAVWLGLMAAVAVAILSLLYSRWRSGRAGLPWKKIIAGLAGLIVLGLLVVQFTSAGVFLRSSFDARYRSNAVRLEYLARLVAPTTNLEALIGRGLGDVTAQNFRTTDVTAFDIASTSSRTVQLAKNSTLVDNQYLKTWIELGLAGLLLYVWIFIRLGKASFRLLKHSTTQALGLVSLAFLSATIVQALFIDIWDIYPTNLAFWIIAGLTSAYQGQDFKNHDDTAATNPLPTT